MGYPQPSANDPFFWGHFGNSGMWGDKRGMASRTRYRKGMSRHPVSVPDTAGRPPFFYKKTLIFFFKPPSWSASGSKGLQLVGSCQCHLGTLI